MVKRGCGINQMWLYCKEISNTVIIWNQGGSNTHKWGRQKVLDIAFVKQYVSHMYDFGFYSLKLRGPGPPWPPWFLHLCSICKICTLDHLCTIQVRIQRIHTHRHTYTQFTSHGPNIQSHTCTHTSMHINTHSYTLIQYTNPIQQHTHKFIHIHL